MSGCVDIPYTNILKEGRTVNSGDHAYIIYVNPKDVKYQIHINAFYIKRDNAVEIRMEYDRSLCETMNEYYFLSSDYIERQAYGAFMDGAR